jgi:hypothetical protein
MKVVFWICLLFFVSSATAFLAAQQKENVVKIEVNNPYSLTIQLEVKCDYLPKRNNFQYHTFIVVPGKKQTILKVPNHLKKCQIWPKIRW